MFNRSDLGRQTNTQPHSHRFIRRYRILFWIGVGLFVVVNYHQSFPATQHQHTLNQIQHAQLHRNLHSNINEDDDEEGITVCLAVKDDNHWLIEWLAYHYHVLPMRTLIVVEDPHAQTSMRPVLDRWKAYLKIIIWTDQDFLDVHDAPTAAKLDKLWLLTRQKAFYPACLRAIRSVVSSAAFSNNASSSGSGRSNTVRTRPPLPPPPSWVAMIDTDEFIRPNPYFFVGEHDSAWSDLTSPGIVSRAIREYESRQQQQQQQSMYNYVAPSCLHIPRFTYTSRSTYSNESTIHNITAAAKESVENSHDHDPTLIFNGKQEMVSMFNTSHFLTTTWFYHPEEAISSVQGDRDGKNVIAVGRLAHANDIPLRITRVHQVLPDPICPAKVPTDTTPLIIHHYYGTYAQYASRSDVRNRKPGLLPRGDKYWTIRNRQGVVRDATMASWLPGFVQQVGRSEAQRLLQDVGVVVPSSSSSGLLRGSSSM